MDLVEEDFFAEEFEEPSGPVYDPESYLLAGSFSRLFEKKDPSLHDVHFLFGEGDSAERVGAHRLLLAAVSPLFEAMLYPDPELGAITEKKEEIDDVLEIKVKDASAKSFRVFLYALYSDKLPPGGESVAEVMKLAQKYQVEKVTVACRDFLKKGVTSENYCDILEHSPALLSDENFKRILEEDTEGVLQSASFLKLSPASMKIILSSTTLAVDEIDLFKAFLAWTDEEIKRKEKKKSDKRELFRELLPLIRFPLMSAADVALHVAPSGLFAPVDLVPIFRYVGADEKVRDKFEVPFPTTARDALWKTALPPAVGAPFGKYNGIVHLLGTNMGKKAWSNPHDSGEAVVSLESYGSGFPCRQLVDTVESSQSNMTDIHFMGKWIQIELKNYSVDITHYAMKNGGGRGLVLRDWNFEARASVEDPWTILLRHSNDQTYANDNKNGFGLHVFQIPHQAKWFRFFRVLRTDSNTNIYCHRLELYGRVRKVTHGAALSSGSPKVTPLDATRLFSCHTHALTHMFPTEYGSGWMCDVCRAPAEITVQSWHCAGCQFDLCDTCASLY